MIRQQNIYEISEQLEIPYLVHFTNVKNIDSIIKNGIYSRDGIEKSDSFKNTVVYVNDTLRLDGYTNAISISIGHPNENMLYKLRKNYPTEEWAVLGIDKSILWSKDCAFFHKNAASSEFKYKYLSSLKSPLAFLNMFKDMEGNYRKHRPFDVQAEVLVFGIIEPQLILGVIFNTEFTKNKLTPVIGNLYSTVNSGSTGVFSTPSYAIF
ncbi:MAG: DarT ssDNA thymidine ADP-ribosyltransferase family protein [Thiolinea sp.]